MNRHDLTLSLAFIKRLFLDQTHIQGTPWNPWVKQTQLNPRIPLFLDRENEIIKYFRIPRYWLWGCYLQKGFPNTLRFKRNLQQYFQERTASHLLKEAYHEASFYYALRLMMAFERYSMVLDYLEAFYKFRGKERKSLRGWTVLDFGCGVSDIGLLLSLLGATVEICDLADQKLNFAQWRYQVRNLKVAVNPQNAVDQPPVLESEKYDLIIATEVFEHLTDPLQNLQALTRSLRPQGLFFNSMGENGHRDIGGDHLEKAMRIMKSQEYQSFYRRHYHPVYFSRNQNFLFQLEDPFRP